AYAGFAALAALAGLWILRLPEPPARSRGAGEAGRNPLSFWMIAGILFFTVAGEAGFANWAFSYARKAGLASETGAGLLTSAYWTSLTLGRLIGIALVQRLGPLRLLTLIVPGALAGSAVFLAFPDAAWAVWTASVLLGLFQASAVPASFTLAGDLGILSGSTAGLFGAVSSLGGMALPWLIGRYFDSTGGAVFPVLIAASQAAALACLVGIRAVRGKPDAGRG
ncbi:MAG TPA: MFS transporter, partial [Spirochaetia bacterium]|nr:MFS transporter [Spirochaetia bacterium]